MAISTRGERRCTDALTRGHRDKAKKAATSPKTSSLLAITDVTLRLSPDQRIVDVDYRNS